MHEEGSKGGESGVGTIPQEETNSPPLVDESLARRDLLAERFATSEGFVRFPAEPTEDQ